MIITNKEDLNKFYKDCWTNETKPDRVPVLAYEEWFDMGIGGDGSLWEFRTAPNHLDEESAKIWLEGYAKGKGLR